MKPEPDEPWKQQEGEPAIKVVGSNGAVVVQSLAIGLTAALVLRPEVATWLGEQLLETARLVKSGIILPHQVPPNGNPMS